MNDRDKQLLQRYLEGNCTDEEIRKVEIMLQQQEAQDALGHLIDRQAADEWQTPVDIDNEMDSHISSQQAEMQRRIAEGQLQSPIRRPLIPMKYLRYAAVWTGVLLISVITFWQLKKTTIPGQGIAYVTQTNKQGIPAKYVLPDSTTIYLAAGSSLRYADQFAGGTREIDLSGEAFFQVAANPEKPFIIHTGEVQTRVLGTSFKVSAFEGQPMEVAVATGKVSVSDHRDDHPNQLALLTAGKKATYDTMTGQVTQGTVAVDALTQWASGEIRFENQRLDRAVQELHRIYGVELKLADTALATTRISSTFSASEPLDSVMDILAFVGKFRYKQSPDGQVFTLYK